MASRSPKPDSSTSRDYGLYRVSDNPSLEETHALIGYIQICTDMENEEAIEDWDVAACHAWQTLDAQERVAKDSPEMLGCCPAASLKSGSSWYGMHNLQ